MKESFSCYYKDNFDIGSCIYNLLCRLNLVKNLNRISKKNSNTFISYNRYLHIKIVDLLKQKYLYIKINSKNKNKIKLIRKIVLEEIDGVKVIYSDYLIDKNMHFFKEFVKCENKLREKIINILTVKYGDGWWNIATNNKIKRICTRRAARDNNRYHDIFYTDFSDIKKIIKSNWEYLGIIFDNNESKLNDLSKLNKKRNKLFHGRFDFIE